MTTYDGGNEIQYTVRTRGIALRDGKFLGVKQGRKWETEMRSLPGGRIDVMEETHLALVREMYEEMNLNVKVGRLLFIMEYIDFKKGRHGIEFLYEIENEDELDISKWEEAEFAHELGAVEWTELDRMEERLEFVRDELKKCGGVIPNDWAVKRFIKKIEV